MTEQNLFAEDWINCLRAHYAHVVHERDTNNEQSLVTVLLQTGFTAEDIDEMRAEATVGMEVIAEPAEPEAIILEEDAYQWVVEPEIAVVEADAYQSTIEPEPAPAITPVEAVINLPPEPPTIEPENVIDPPADTNEEEPPDSFVQMSLF